MVTTKTPRINLHLALDDNKNARNYNGTNLVKNTMLLRLRTRYLQNKENQQPILNAITREGFG
jgi:hypothetical protein